MSDPTSGHDPGRDATAPPGSDAAFAAAEARLKASQQSRMSTPVTSSGKPPSVMDVRTQWGLIIIVGLLAVGWYSTFVEMWHRWFPAWKRTGYSLTDRLTEGDSYYTHGPLVPIICLFFAYLIYKRVGLPIHRTVSSTFFAWIVLAGSLFMHLMSVFAQVTFISGFALIGVLAALVLLWGGWPLFRAYWLPVIFLVFMVPLPEVAIIGLNFYLKNTAGTAAVWLTDRVFGIPVMLVGSYVHFVPDEDGMAKYLVIENVCSGLRSLIALTFFASLFAVVCRVNGLWRVFMLVLAVPVAVASNIVRITSLNLVAHYYGIEAAGPESWFHNFTGLMVFAVALGILFGVESLIMFMDSRFKRGWTDARLMGFLDRIPRFNIVSPQILRPGTIAALVISAGLSLFWSQQLPSQNMSSRTQNAVPDELDVADRVWASEDFEVDKQVKDILETDDILSRRYISNRRDEFVELMIVFSENNRKGTHPPEVCLEGSGHVVVEARTIPLNVPEIGQFRAVELITQNGRWTWYHLYFYKCGPEYTPSFWRQQWVILRNGLFGRDSSGALIRYTVLIRDDDTETARYLATNIAISTMPQLHQSLMVK